MSQAMDQLSNPFAIDAARDERAAFIRNTYAHLAGAIAVFAGLLYVFVNTPAIAEPLVRMMMGGQWWIIFAGFIAASWLGDWWANRSTSLTTQYAGLMIYTVAEAVIFVPIVYAVSMFMGQPELITQAALLTLITFGGLTAFVMFTGADFSFLRGFLMLASLAAFGVIIAGMFFGGFHLGLWFTVAMLGLSAGYILYDTSNIMHHYRTDQHVAASLALFASVALMFWYMIQLVIALQGND
ncbi:Bax inhibitor-1 family protein [Rubinisphaera sp. JC750]|uniref:Bax inhibitor-1/YccA family protein n=1 Tax=Rubinisphaera sp. JC750 TaxID=2898658 RepID=UPI001F408BEC|nr:Bax inhibitor-1 family protein [Rubinisphaera sp. JC750]